MKWRTVLLVSIVCLTAVGIVSAQTYGGTQSQQPSQHQQHQQQATQPQGTQQEEMGEARTITGTVVSSTSTSLVIDTTTGRRTFIVDSDSRVPSGLMAGNRVTVEYHTLSGGRFHAANVTTLGTGTEPTPTTETTEPTERELPRTASELPLVGLVGLLALGGALALRHLRRRTA